MKKYITIEDVIRTFNRTSMESKHRLNDLRKPKVLLLIEPVWNRNVEQEILIEACCFSFNRTSMESKHQLPKLIERYERRF